MEDKQRTIVCDVVVIGAGASGTAAAMRLVDKNPTLSVIVLEARNVCALIMNEKQFCKI